MSAGDGLARLRQALADHGSTVRGSAAQCPVPAHEDRQASLSIGQGRDGAVVKCHKGCATDAVLEALGMSAADLFDEPRSGRPAVTAEYHYRDEDGGLLYTIRRYEPGFDGERKTFRPFLPSGSAGLGPVRRILYRLPRVIEAVQRGETVYITEGEKDVHAIERAGGVATTNPGGAGNTRLWRLPGFTAPLKGAAVRLVADRDEAGRKHARAVAASLDGIAASVEIVEAATGNDAHDHLAAGHGLGDFRPAADADADAAGPFTPVSLAGLIRGGVPQPELLDGGGLLYAAGIHVISGAPDCGKTTIALWQALTLLRARTTVLILDEEGGADMTAEKLIALGATEADAEHLCYVPFPSVLWGAEDVASLTRLVTAIRPAMVLFDSCAAFMARAGLDENSAADVTSWWARVLAPLARVHQAAVTVIDHDAKNGESRFSRGSGAKLAASDVMIKAEMVTPFSRSMNGLLKLTVTKDRRGWLHRWHEAVVRTGDGIAIEITRTGGDVPGRADMPPAKAKLLEALEAVASAQEPAEYGRLVDYIVATHGHGLKRQTCSTLLNQLASEGLADFIDRGPGHSKLWFPTRQPVSDTSAATYLSASPPLKGATTGSADTPLSSDGWPPGSIGAESQQ